MPIEPPGTESEGDFRLEPAKTLYLSRPLRFLKPDEISLIDELLSKLDAQEELHLVIQKGRLRFVTKTTDFDETQSE